MWTRPAASLRASHAGQALRPLKALHHGLHLQQRRGLLTLAIETSCDDTSVAVLETIKHNDAPTTAKLHFHDRITANTASYGGIHPVVALESHQRSLAPLVQKAIAALPTFDSSSRLPASTSVLWGSSDGQLHRKPDFVCATRGPGMRASLSVGLNVAKGLATAWDVPLVGVHHMQAHALTPRLVNALEGRGASKGECRPAFPFLSLLVSGGHTMLVESKGLAEHVILASTSDIALGDCLDKAARVVVPVEKLVVPYGRALEDFAFSDGATSYDYVVPRTREEELRRTTSQWGWALAPPLAEGRGGRSANRMEYSFSGLLSSLERAFTSASGNTRSAEDVSEEERGALAREVQRVAFEHLGGRLLLYMKALAPEERQAITTLVISGGVAANRFLRHVLKSMLEAQKLGHVELISPPIELCGDNAAMIAWAGCEMYETGWRSALSVEPIRKWSLDSTAENGGVLGVAGWQRQSA